MKIKSCTDVAALLDGFRRRELEDGEAAAVDRHLRGCSACAAASRRSAALDEAVDVLKGDEVIAAVPEARFHAMRARVMSEVRAEVESRASRRWSFGLSFGFASLLAALVGLTALQGVDPGQRETLTASTLQDGSAQQVSLRTISGPEGVTLTWDGADSSYMVVKTTRSGKGTAPERTVVCGRRWTDRSATAGVVFYSVVPVPEPCRS